MILNREIISKGETYFVEFMENADEALPDEVCAFANASGGKIFIGIADSGFVAGTEISNRARAFLYNMVTRVEPKVEFTIDVVLSDNVFVIAVQEGKDKPYSAPSGYYLRVGRSKVKLARDQLAEYIQREGNVRYDEIIRNDLPLSERFDEAAYEKYITAAGISNALNREAVLENLCCAAKKGNDYVFTNAGALFFRQNEDDAFFPHSAIVCVLYRGLTQAHVLDEQRFDADLVSNIDNALLFLRQNLRVRYGVKSIRREEILELPEPALREAVINAVCHRDYFKTGLNIMVEIYNDRVEITSPGGAPSVINSQNLGSICIRRNPIISGMIHRIDYSRKEGPGIGLIREETAKAGVVGPMFESDTFFRVAFKRSELCAGPANTSDNAPLNTSVNITNKEWEVLNIISDNSNITVHEIAARLGRSRTAISDRISILKKKGFLKREGADKNGYWEII
ncbi:MAG: putative DNA binding domain-containing protein [Clostridiales bacterium]|nr:putative DNA binding domain-containing protein [Clostridiales bacterium]